MQFDAEISDHIMTQLSLLFPHKSPFSDKHFQWNSTGLLTEKNAQPESWELRFIGGRGGPEDLNLGHSISDNSERLLQGGKWETQDV